MNDVYEDQEWLFQFKNNLNKESAFTKIVIKYQERLYWIIRRLVVTHENANDVVQNVFIKVWKGLDGFREDCELFTWLYKIATNESLSFLHNEKKRHAFSLQEYEEYCINKVKADVNFHPNQIEWKLNMAIQELPDKQKLVFLLRYYDEMPYEKMSEILNTSVGALKASYHHAIKKIEKKLSDQ